MVLKHWLYALCIGGALAGHAAADTQIAFDGTWREQGLLRFFSKTFTPSGSELGIATKGSVSLLWRPLDRSLWTASGAHWDWTVTASVPPTDLKIRGGDDRNAAVYFVFVDPDRAEALVGRNARRILREPSARALTYIWGGDDPRGTGFASPYSDQLWTIVRRPAGTGAHSETVSFADDYRAAFGAAPGLLVGLAISADSDDTEAQITAQIASLTLID